MSQDTDTGGGTASRGRHATGPQQGGPHQVAPEQGGHHQVAPEQRRPPMTGPHPVDPRHMPYPPHPPRPGMPVQGPPGYRPAPGPAPAWAPIDDVEDPRPPGNPAASFSAVLGVLGLLLSLRPLAFGSMQMTWDTYVAIVVAVLALFVGGAGLRTPVRRPVAVVGMAIAVLALLVVAVLPTF